MVKPNRYSPRDWKPVGLVQSLIGALLLWMIICPAKAEITPPWSHLKFAKTYLWVDASAELSLKSVASKDALAAWRAPESHVPLRPPGEEIWQLAVNGSVASNQARAVNLLDPDNLSVYRRSRYSEGRDSRLKSYLFLEDGVTRQRREPAQGEENTAPGSWAVVSTKFIPYPQGIDHSAPLTSAEALLLVASTARLEKPGDSWTGFIFSDLDFLHVQLKVASREYAVIDYQLTGHDGSCAMTDRKPVILIDVITMPVGKEKLHDEFELLGMTGKLRIVLDPSTHLPAKLWGHVPRFGYAAIDLVSAQSDKLSCGS